MNGGVRTWGCPQGRANGPHESRPTTPSASSRPSSSLRRRTWAMPRSLRAPRRTRFTRPLGRCPAGGRS
eukprot:14553850-Alexandrium_andersonii.AAC.1